jgi:hypothetical protein
LIITGRWLFCQTKNKKRTPPILASTTIFKNLIAS